MFVTDHVDVLIIGSGAGGAVTALELARAGRDVLVLEEGSRYRPADYGGSSTDAMRKFYRKRGMTPIVGRVPIGFVEGCCVGGSTEINSGFWHRTPREILMRWQVQFALNGASEADLRPHFEWAEKKLGVGLTPATWPPSTAVFARGLEHLGWSFRQVPRAAPGCTGENRCAMGCPTGRKRGMSLAILPAAETRGARILPNCRAELLLRRGKTITGVAATLRDEDGTEQLVRIDAEAVFVCAGPIGTPAILQRSGIRYRVGNTLRIHPYLKVAARFKEELDAERSVLPLVQVKEFGPDLSLGGAFFTVGHLAMLLGDNWPSWKGHVNAHRHMAIYYVGVRGTGRGSVRPSLVGDGRPTVRYELSEADRRHLGDGLARLSSALLAAGATQVCPSVTNMPAIRSEHDAIRWLDTPLPRRDLSLVTVHAFSSCPMGDRRERCAADSFGRVYGFENLFINDASMLPDSPGVNPQASIMALARRNALAFAERSRCAAGSNAV